MSYDSSVFCRRLDPLGLTGAVSSEGEGLGLVRGATFLDVMDFGLDFLDFLDLGFSLG